MRAISKKTHIAHNNHNVYICGAGFSDDGGVPMVSSFYSKMRDACEWLSDTGRISEANAIQEVINFRLTSSAAGYWTKLDLENIEELFSLAAASSKQQVLDSIPIAISATIDFCRAKANPRPIYLTSPEPLKYTPPGIEPSDTGALFPPNNFTNFTAHIDRYTHHVGKLLGVFNDGKEAGENTFITFNYDTLIEEGLIGLNFPFSYALPQERVQYHSSQKSDFSGKAKIKVLKLHGSMNWAKKKSLRGKDLTVFDRYDHLKKPGLIPEIIPPTWQKIFSGPLTSIWEEAVKSISTATRVVIIGFSIPKTDNHFKYLLSAGLSQNASLRSIHVVDPDQKQQLRTRIKEFLTSDLEDRDILKFHNTSLLSFTTQRATGNANDIGRIWPINHSFQSS